MPLTCSCDYEAEPGSVIWLDPDDYTTLQTKRRQRCCSCGDLIDIGAVVGVTRRFKVPETEIECRIYGEDGEVPLADKFLCEECTDILFSLEELGYCVYAGENQKEVLKEYQDLKSAMTTADIAPSER